MNQIIQWSQGNAGAITFLMLLVLPENMVKEWRVRGGLNAPDCYQYLTSLRSFAKSLLNGSSARQT